MRNPNIITVMFNINYLINLFYMLFLDNEASAAFRWTNGVLQLLWC